MAIRTAPGDRRTPPPAAGSWPMPEEVAYSRRLDDQLHVLRSLAMGGGAATAETIAAIARQIRHEAAEGGFDGIGRAAAALCAFVESGGYGDEHGGAVLARHVDAMIARKADRDTGRT